LRGLANPKLEAYFLISLNNSLGPLAVLTGGVTHLFKYVHDCRFITFSRWGLFEPSATCSVRCGLGLLGDYFSLVKQQLMEHAGIQMWYLRTSQMAQVNLGGLLSSILYFLGFEWAFRHLAYIWKPRL